MADSYTVLDITDAIVELCKKVSTIDFSYGVPKLIHEGILSLPNVESVSDLPIVIIDTLEDMKISNSNMSAQQCSMEVPIDIWYIRPGDTTGSISDILRSDAALLCRQIWGSNLFETVNNITVVGMDWSQYNVINANAIDNDLDIVGVSVRIVLEKIISRWII